ncbi:hypothetical protein M0813_11883 [Anaeramoeba flamelloides]|uniref:Uncharacterized protein n=1 Tax=Anaeramoeba flamelloides TaxID=1746091 RepID=A0ABQ8ZD99_9EUKA|nr:hypothetical protein M0813_11883 [Anaeramoeba flamelloides]
MGNKQNTILETGSLQYKKRKYQKKHHLVLLYDQSNTLTNFLQLHLKEDNFEFHGFKSSVVSYSYSDLKYWGYEKNKLLMVIKENIIIFTADNAVKIFEEIDHNINTIYKHLHPNSQQKLMKRYENIFNMPQRVNY